MYRGCVVWAYRLGTRLWVVRVSSSSGHPSTELPFWIVMWVRWGDVQNGFVASVQPSGM